MFTSYAYANISIIPTEILFSETWELVKKMLLYMILKTFS